MERRRILLSLHRPWSLIGLGGGVVAGSLGLAILVGWRGSGVDSSDLIYGLVAAALVCGAICLSVGLLQRSGLPSYIDVCSDGLKVSDLLGIRGAKSIRWKDIEAASVGKTLGQRRLFLYVPGGRRLLYPERAFPTPEDFDDLYEEIRENVGNLPGGSGRLKRSAAAQRVGDSMAARRTWFVYLWAGVLPGFYFAVQGVGPLAKHPLGMALLGGNASALTLDGDPWRVLTASLLHLDLVHLATNVFAAMTAVRILERVLGRARLVVLYTAGAAMGGLASALFSGFEVSIGASPGIYGLVGAWVSLWWRRRDELPIPARFTPRFMVRFFAIGALVELFWPGLDVAAHAGGFVAGLLFTPLLLRRPLAEAVSTSAPAGIWLAAGVAAAAFVAAGGWVLQAEERLCDRVSVEAFRQIGERPFGLVMLNEAAWEVAIDPEAEPELLAWAIRRLEAAPGATGLPPVTDTLATLYYRSDDFERAIALAGTLERGPQTVPDRAFYASQRARFEYARALAQGPSEAGDCRAPVLQSDEAGLHATISSGCHSGAEIRWAAIDREAQVGFVVVTLGPNPPASSSINGPDLPEQFLGPRVSFALTSVAAPGRALAPGFVEWQARLLDPAVQRLP